MAKVTFTFISTVISENAKRNAGQPIYLCVGTLDKTATANFHGEEVSGEVGVSFILDDKLQTAEGRDLLQKYGDGSVRERVSKGVSIFARGARNTFTVDIDADIDTTGKVEAKPNSSTEGYGIYGKLTVAGEDKVFDGLQEALDVFQEQPVNP